MASPAAAIPEEGKQDQNIPIPVGYKESEEDKKPHAEQKVMNPDEGINKADHPLWHTDQNKELDAAVKRMVEKYGIDAPLATLALNEELEHKDVTGGDIGLTEKIASAHLDERKDYYKKLQEAGLIGKQMETGYAENIRASQQRLDLQGGRNRIGEKQKEIDGGEIEKATFSPHAPKVKPDNDPEPITNGETPPGDIFGKAEDKGIISVGSFSGPQKTAEETNYSAPDKSKDSRERTNKAIQAAQGREVEGNKEPYYYKSVIDDWFDGVEKTTDPYEALVDLKLQLIKSGAIRPFDIVAGALLKNYDMGKGINLLELREK